MKDRPMAANIEFKARLRDVMAQELAAVEVAQAQPEILFQRDTFFHVTNGRLKLREVSGAEPHLIQYFRPDEAELRRCDYNIVPIADPTMFIEAMERAQGIRGIVRKMRKLWVVGQTRIHFDHVDELGDFVELEVVLEQDQTDQVGQSIARGLMERLAIKNEDIVELAYIDLLERQAGQTAAHAASELIK